MSFFSPAPLPRWKTDVFLAFAVALNYADRSVLPVIFPAIRAELNLSDVAFGLLGSLFLWSYALCGPFAGMLADSTSRRVQVVVSLAAWSAATALTGWANGFAWLVALRLVLGIAESLYLPAAAALIGDHHGPTTRGRAIGLQTISQSVGIIVGSACAGFVAEHHGWRWSFWTLGAAGLGLALIAPKFLGAVPAATARPAGSAGVRPALRYLLGVPTYFFLLTETILSGCAVWIFFNWMPLYLYETHHLTVAGAGFSGMMMLQGSSMLGVVVGAWISDRVARRAAGHRLLVFGGAYLVAAPGLLLFLFEPSYPAVVAVVSGFSFLRTVGAVNQLAVLCDVIPSPYRSTAVGFFLACACAAGGAGVLMAGLLKQGFGLASTFAALSGVFCLAGLGLLLSHRLFVVRDIAKANAWAAAKPVDAPA